MDANNPKMVLQMKSDIYAAVILFSSIECDHYRFIVFNRYLYGGNLLHPRVSLFPTVYCFSVSLILYQQLPEGVVLQVSLLFYRLMSLFWLYIKFGTFNSGVSFEDPKTSRSRVSIPIGYAPPIRCF